MPSRATTFAGTRRVALLLAVALLGALVVPVARAADPAPAIDGRIDETVHVPTRYGDRITIALSYPAHGGQRVPGRFPVIAGLRYLGPLDGTSDYVLAGYVAATVSVPGSGTSEFGPFNFSDPKWQRMVYDAIEWLGTQPWSTGKVGTIGESGNGESQIFTGPLRPPHLTTMIPIVSGYDSFDLVMPGGMQSIQIAVLACGIIGAATMASHGVGVPTSQDELEYLVEMNKNKYENAQVNAFCPVTNGMWNHRQRDEFWVDPWTAKVEDVTIPVWAWGGWNDIFRLSIPKLYASVGSKDKLLTMGLNSHGSPGGPDGFDRIKESLRWFDYWLKGRDTGIRRELDTNRFRYYVNQEFRWKTARTWPIPGTRYTPWYLGGATDAPLAAASLSPTAPTIAGTNSYVYDPTSGRANSLTYDFAAPLSAASDGTDQPQGYGVDSPQDQRLELGPGTVAYVSPPLAGDMELTGPVTAQLFASTSATDTDFVLKLVDVFPDTPGAIGPGRPGYWNLVTDGNISGVLRSYETGYRAATPIPPGKVVQFGIRLDPTSYLFRKDHRVALVVESADVPRLMPNPNPAQVTVYHSAQYPSRVVLPLIPR